VDNSVDPFWANAPKPAGNCPVDIWLFFEQPPKHLKKQRLAKNRDESHSVGAWLSLMPSLCA
jgi:hypothetical protein